MTKIFIFLVLSSTIVCISSLYSFERRETCGHNIPTVLSAVCDGKYWSPKFKKSSREDFGLQNGFSNSFSNEEFIPEYEEYLRLWELMGKGSNERRFVPLPFPWKARNDAFGMSVNRFRREAGGIVEECCEKACTLDEMRGYCG